jgi:hypothetical protein
MEFLCSSDSDLASRQRFWATEKGWDGTMDLVRVVRSKFRATSEGEKRWQEYIQEEVGLSPCYLIVANSDCGTPGNRNINPAST